MVVLLLGRSGKSLLVVDDYGDSFITSVRFLEDLLAGRSPRNFLLCKRLGGARTERFVPSPLLGDPFSSRSNKVLVAGDVVGSVVEDLGDW